MVQKKSVAITIKPAPVRRKSQNKVLLRVPDKPPERDGISVNPARHGVIRLRLPLAGVPGTEKLRAVLAQGNRTLETIVGTREGPQTRQVYRRRRGSFTFVLPNRRHRGSRRSSGCGTSLHAEIGVIQKEAVTEPIKTVAIG